jgi:hypothetical protein
MPKWPAGDPANSHLDNRIMLQHRGGENLMKFTESSDEFLIKFCQRPLKIAF